jgi:predicted Zn-dependent peptidase
MKQPDRRTPPDKYDITVSIPAEPDIFTLDNGVPVYIHNSGTEDIIRIEFFFRAGSSLEQKTLAASTANMMLFEGTRSFSAAKLASRLDYYGSHPQQFCDNDSAGISIVFLNKYAENLMPICREMLFEPVFPAKEFNQVMKKRLQWYNVSRQKVSALATEKFNELTFGSDHPYGRAVKKEDFRNLSVNDVSSFHSTTYLPATMAVFVSGKTDNKICELINDYFGDIKKGRKSVVPVRQLQPYAGGVKEHIKKKNSVQAALRIGKRNITKTHPDYTGLKVVDTLLGGYFGSRLMSNLREDKGYTYGIHSSLVSMLSSGKAVISADVGATYVSESVDEIFKEVEKLRTDTVTENEMRVVRNYMLGELLRMFDGPFSVSESFRSVWEFGLDNTYFVRLAERIKNITPDEIRMLAKAYYKPEDFVTVTVGP